MVKDSEQQEMTLPNSPEAEEAVLAALLLDPTQLDTLGLKPGDFYSAWNKEIFRAMLALNRDNKPITWLHMYEVIIGQAGHPNKPGEDYIDVTYLREVFDSAITAVHLHADAALVKEKAVKRALLVGLAQVTKKAQNGTKLSDLDAMLVEARAGLQEPDTKQQTISLADLLAEEDEAEPWLVDHLLTQGGLSLLNGKPGAGKTTFARDMALSVAQGKRWLGRDVAQGHVLFLALEEQKRQVKHHMQMMGATAKDEITFCIQPMHDDPMAVLARLIAQLTPTLIIIDPIARFLHCKDFNDYAQMSAAIDPLIDLAHKTGAHVCLIHHARKGEAGIDSYLGSTALSGSVDTSLLLDLDASGRRILSTIKQRGDGHTLEPTVLAISEETHRIEIEGTRAEAVQHNVESDMLAYLEKQTVPIQRQTVLDEVKGNTTDKSHALVTLIKKGLVARKTMGRSYVCWINRNSSTSTFGAKSRGRAEEMPALPLPDPLGSGRGRANGGEQKSMIDEREKMTAGLDPRESPDKQKSPASPTVEEQADALLTNEVETDATIEAGWWQTMGPDSTEPPPDGSAAFHAQRLSNLLGERLKGQFATPEALANRTEPYNDKINAVGCLRQWTALRACGVVIAAEPTVEEAPL